MCVCVFCIDLTGLGGGGSVIFLRFIFVLSLTLSLSGDELPVGDEPGAGGLDAVAGDLPVGHQRHVPHNRRVHNGHLTIQQ